MTLPKSKVASERKFVGAYVSPRISDYLILYSIAKQTHKTKIIRNVFESWLVSTRVKEPDKILIDDIRDKAMLRWKIDRKITPNKTIEEFKNELERELSIKGLHVKYINSILVGIH